MIGYMQPVTTPASPLAAVLQAHPDVSEARRAALVRAADLGADEPTLVRIATAFRLRYGATMTLPPHRFEGLSRGKGWARCGRGNSAVWGERSAQGYIVGPGTWVVGGDDGFVRKGSETWEVAHIHVGTETWTIAS